MESCFRSVVPGWRLRWGYRVCRRSRHAGDGRSEREKRARELLENAATMEDRVPRREEDVWATPAYPHQAKSRDQASHSLRPLGVDPKTTSIIIFPGQGTQYVGMGKNLVKFPSVRDLFESASSILKYDLLKLCLEGPQERLNRTEYAQPAIMVSSLAALERLKEERPSAIENCVATAGFSLGEISALVFAQALSFETAVRLVKIRGEAMQLASETEEGAMINILFGPDSNLGLACQRAKEHAASQGIEKPYCAVSNYLFPHGKIVAGHEQAIQYLEENKAEFKIRKIKRLPVSGAFHTPLMNAAVDVFKSALAKCKVNDPVIAVHSNVDGKHYRDAEHIRRQLPRQIVAPVKWEQTLHILYERPEGKGFPTTYECGPGKSLMTILKMVNAKASDSCFNIMA